MVPITFITDFGLSDEYAGVMKGVVYTINPSATLVDITHRIPPQDILKAGVMLASTYTYFPKDTIHVAVVDPSVGSARKILFVRVNGHRFIVPDNGLITPVISHDDPDQIVSVENSEFFLEKVSRTFHGRDIIAPVAAHLSLGLDPLRLGPVIQKDSLATLHFQPAFFSGDKVIEGAVVSMDRFGNLITNISEQMLEPLLKSGGEKAVEIDFSNTTIKGIMTQYHGVMANTPMAIFSSRGMLEIAVNKGSARKYFGASVGDPVRVSLRTLSSNT